MLKHILQIPELIKSQTADGVLHVHTRHHTYLLLFLDPKARTYI